MKQPLLKLIHLLNELNTCGVDVPGYIMDGIIDYLDDCKCCAFCNNNGSHDNCREYHDDDFNPDYWCDYFKDKRDDEKYRQPNGTAWDFYKEIDEKTIGE